MSSNDSSTHMRGRELLPLAALLAAGVLLWVLAYQVPLHTTLFVGGNVATHRREDDAPFLHNFNASEPFDESHWQWWELEPGYGYRWTMSNATVTLPGVGGGQWVVSLLATSGRPNNEPATATWNIGDAPPLPLTLPATPRVYHLLADTTGTDGDLRLMLRAPPYDTPGDPREKGFALREVRVAPTQRAVSAPALPTLGWLTLALAALATLGRWLALRVRGAVLVGGGIAVVLAYLLAFHRLPLTVYAPILAGVALSCWPLSLLFVRLLTSAGMRRSTAGPVVALVVLAFALRVGGMLHPHAIFNDHLLNANNLLQVGLGDIYFTEGLPAEAGGGQAPYPPGSYLLAAPAQLLAPTDIEHRALVIQCSVALFDSLVAGALWWMLSQAGAGRRAALVGAALYLLPAPLMKSFSIGEYANIGGQAMILPALLLLSLRRVPLSPLLVAVSLWFALLGHMGVSISLVLLLAALWALRAGLSVRERLICRHTSTPHTTALAALTRDGLLAAVAAAACYYTAPLFVPIFASRLSGNGADADAHATASAPPPLWEHLTSIARGFLPAYSQLSPLLVGCGLVGVVLLWQRCGCVGCHNQDQPPPHRQLQPFTLVVTAWVVGTLLSFGLLLVAGQGVRWSHFVYPALCLGAASLLAALWRRGTAGRVVAGAGLLVPVVFGLVVWFTRLRDYWH